MKSLLIKNEKSLLPILLREKCVLLLITASILISVLVLIESATGIALAYKSSKPLESMGQHGSSPLADGTIDPTFNASVTEGSGFVTETAVQSDGKIVVVGFFQGANGMLANNITRFNANGTVDPTFTTGQGANALVHAVALQSDGKIVIGGAFTSFNGQAVPRIVRLNADGTIDNSFVSGVAFNNEVRDITLQLDGKILVGGLFSTLSSRLIRLNSTGSLDIAFSGFPSSVLAIAIDSTGRIVTGGDQGTPARAIKRINSDGSVDSTFTPGTGPSSTVMRLVLQPDGKIIASGTFLDYNGITTDGLVRINENGTLDTAFDHIPPGSDPTFENAALALQTDGKIIVGYHWVDSTGHNGRIARFNTNGTIDPMFIQGDLDSSWATDVRVLSSNKILVGGYFVKYNNEIRIRVAQLNPDGAIDSSFSPSVSYPAAVRAIKKLPSGKLLIGGDFQFTNGVHTRGGIARLNADGSLDSSFQLDSTIHAGHFGGLYTFAVQPDQKIVIGTAYAILSRLNPNGTLDTSFVPSFGNYFAYPIRAIGLQSDGKIVVAGNVTGPNGIYVAIRFNTNGSFDNTFTTLRTSNGGGQALFIQADDKILVGGTYTSTLSEFPRFGSARLDQNGILNIGFNNNIGQVYSWAQQADGKILSVGSNLTRLSSEGIVDPTLNTGSGFDQGLRAVLPQSGGKILVGGLFTTYNGTAVNRIARTNFDGSLDTTFVTSGTSGTVLALETQGDGKALVGGSFWDFGGVAKSSLVRLQITAPTIRSPFDLDGDGKTDLSIFRPNGAASEWWWLKSGTGGNAALQFGASTDRLVPSDYTGDGKTDVAFWRPSTGQWFVLRSEDFSFYAFPFGATGDVPVPGDFDGDGKSDAAVFRESAVTWFINKSSGGTDIVGFGAAGDRPVNADYDGDGKSDIAIFRPSGVNGAEWWVRRSTNASVFALQFGNSTDKAVPGDFTGDGKADVAFWRPATGFWNVLRSEDFSYYAFPFGANGDTPVPGDYDGDGKIDAGVFRQPGAQWFVNKSTGGTLIQSFGITGDVPLPNSFVR